MNCPQCSQPLENGAIFCGNCGQALQAAPTPPPLQPGVSTITISAGGQAFSPVPPNAGSAALPLSLLAQVFANPLPTTVQPGYTGLPVGPAVSPAMAIPSYALSTAQSVNTKLVLALVFGIAGIIGALFMAILGIVLGVAGIVLATTAPRSERHKLKIAGLVLSTLAILVGLGVWVSVIAETTNLAGGNRGANVGTSTNGVAGTTTPCYSFSFASTSNLNVENTSAACSLNAYNASSLATSSEIYKVLSSTAPTINKANFAGISKTAIEQDIRQSLPSFVITSGYTAQFAGSPAYVVNAVDSATNVAFQETTVLHATTQGDNLFVLIHAKSGSKTDLSELEANWQWK